MKYSELISRAHTFAVFGDDLFAGGGGEYPSRRIQLSRWAKQGKIIRLKRGLYTLPEEFRKAPLSLRWLANTLYSPSYLSLEYMLSWYDMIPERVTTLTSVSTRKTAAFTNALGRFSYRTLQKEHFCGFEEVQDEFGQPILAATPEKALLDTIYLYAGWQNSEDFLLKNLRLQQLDQLNAAKMKKAAARFESKKMTEAAVFILETR